MPDEPSNSELAWRLDRIQNTINGVVGHPEYAADKRGIDHRLNQAEQDLDQERRDRIDADKAILERLDAHLKSHTDDKSRLSTLIWMGFVPAMLGLTTVIVTIALH